MMIPKPDDLKEMSHYLNTGSDGIFNEGDYLLFFAKGTGRWNYNNSTGIMIISHHNYSDTAFYFITSGISSWENDSKAIEPSQPANYPHQNPMHYSFMKRKLKIL